jgi:hypothetical protein
MPKQEQPITHRPKQEDEHTGRGQDRHGAHRQDDEALPGKGSEKAGLNRQSQTEQGQDK